MTENLFGLPNVGNSCFVNSILQVFLNCDLLMEEIDKIELDVPSFLYYLKTLKRLSSSRHKTFLDFVNFIQQKSGFNLRQQNDSHEFLVRILDIIEDENKEIYNLFIGTKVSELKCERCEYKNRISEDYNSLNFYLNTYNKFSNLLNAEFECDIIDNCKCEKCGNTRLINRKYIDKFPKILIVLNSNMRFHISFNDIIKIIDFHGNKVHYSLIGTVNHQGSLLGGHYTFSTKEYTIDDISITKVQFPNDFKNAYMIAYFQHQ